MSDSKKFADDFCGWSLPPRVRPDNIGADGFMRPDSTGTNLLTHAEAEEMFQAIVMPCVNKLRAELQQVREELKKKIERLRTTLAAIAAMPGTNPPQTIDDARILARKALVGEGK